MKSKFSLAGVIFILGVFFIVKMIWGGTRETKYDVPLEFQGVELTFEAPMLYQIGKPFEEISSFPNVNTKIVPDEEYGNYYPDIFQYTPVSTSTKFTMLSEVNIANYGLMSVDSGTLGSYYYLLQDENEAKSYISASRFKSYISTIKK